MKKICLGFLLAWLGCAAAGFGTTFNVNSNFDDGSNNTIVGTIRYAVNQANTQPGGPHVVNLNAGGNSITVCAPLTLSGNQINVVGNGNTVASISSGNNVFNVTGSACLIRNMVIRDGAIGVNLQSNSNRIYNCMIRNNVAGIVATFSNFNVIGGTDDSYRNYIVGNSLVGIEAVFNNGLTVQRNYIGLNSDGSVNSNGMGIYLSTQVNNCWIGGPAGNGNIISGNTSYGLYMEQDSNSITVCGNIIGLNPSQTSSRPNGCGILMLNSPGNFIGRTDAYNVIAGNTSTGISVMGSSTSRSENTVIQNNYIGLSDSNGSFPNNTGIELDNADSCLIGGNRGTGSEKNVISMNTTNGVRIFAGNGNTICGNYIGTNIAGVAGMGNGTGIKVDNHSHNNLIGGANISAGNQRGNVISASVANGIDVIGANSNSVVGNYVGLTADGNAALPNNAASLNMDSAFACLVGGRDATLKNIFDEAVYLTNGAAGNTLVGNWANVFANGSLDTQSGGFPAFVLDGNAHDNWVGVKNGGGNLITVSNRAIQVSNAGAINNGLFGNTICSSFDPGTAQRIFLVGSGNNNKLSPAISTANAGVVSGQAQIGDYIEVFKADRNGSYNGGSLIYLGSEVPNGTVNWSVSVAGVSNGDFVCALASDGSNNTSDFSVNFRYGPPYTPTITPSSTVTPTPTATPTITVSPTATSSSTASPTSTITPTNTVSPTISATGTISPTSTISPTLTVSPTSTPTTTATLTASPTTNSLANVNGILAFPNPGKKQINFVLHLDTAAEAKIDIYNINGELAAKLTASLPAGRGQVIVWDCSQAGAGVYVAKVFLGDKLEKTLKVAVVH